MARELLTLEVVHAIFFGLKRAFHGTLRVTRPMLASLGLTAARFDLLYALPGPRRGKRRGTWQSLLRRKLGVSRPTVSRMLGSLEELGLVSRTREQVGLDRRQVLVALTDAGHALLRKATRLFLRSGLVRLAVDTALGAELGEGPLANRWHVKSDCLIATDTLDGLLRKVRHEFGDFAKLDYPWHPDD
jgi:DNA-binding MarR family transcriptional regulator